MSSSPTAFPHHYLFVTWTAKVRRNTVVPETPQNSRPYRPMAMGRKRAQSKWNRHHRIETPQPSHYRLISLISHISHKKCMGPSFTHASRQDGDLTLQDAFGAQPDVASTCGGETTGLLTEGSLLGAPLIRHGN